MGFFSSSRERFVIICLPSPQQKSVHSIGDRDDGKVWEHLLSLIDAPFLALSATVANPQGE